MSFRIGYKKYLTVRCWHDFFLGPDLAEADMPPTVSPSGDQLMAYLNYDVRDFLGVRPLAESGDLLRRLGLDWRASTQGGWLLARSSVSLPADARLVLALLPLGAEFSARTDLGPKAPRQVAYLSADSVSIGAGTQVQGWGKDWLATTPRIGYATGVVNLPVNDPDAAIELTLPNEATVLRTYSKVVVTEAGTKRVLPLKGLSPGRYRFRGPGIVTTDLLVNYSIPPQAVAVLDLALAEVSEVTFDLRFTAKQPATFKL